LSQSDSSRFAGRGLAWGLAGAVLLWQLVLALQPELTPLDHEELYNAAHARLLQLGHLDAFQQLQYRSYCGGCTVNALMGAAVFSVVGPSLWAWKVVPSLYSAVAVLFGARALHQRMGRLAAVVFAGLFVLPPPTWRSLSLVGWGNHMEAGCVAVVALVLTVDLIEAPTRRGAIGLGIVVGLAQWIGFSGGFVALAVAGALIWTGAFRHLAWVILGALPAAGLWGLQAMTTDLSIFDPIYYPGERLPELSRIPTKLASLLAPRQLVALFGHPDSTVGWVLGWAWAAVGGWAVLGAWRKGLLPRTAAGFLFSFLAIYSVVRFTVWTPPSPEIATPGSMRYAAPVYPILFLCIGAAVGVAWREGRRRIAMAALLPLLGIGILTQISALGSPFPSDAALTMQAGDMPYFRDQAGYRLTRADHVECTCSDPQSQAIHAYGVGWHDAQAAIDGSGAAPLPVLSAPEGLPAAPYFEAVGLALLAQLDSDEAAPPSLLIEASERLGAQSSPNRITALTALAWRRSEAWLSLARDGRPHDRRVLQQVAAMADRLPAEPRAAFAFSIGRRWAHDLGRWAAPGPVALPTKPPTQFLRGVAYGLGVLWGPDVDLRDHLHLTDSLIEAVEADYLSGTQSRWLTPQTH